MRIGHLKNSKKLLIPLLFTAVAASFLAAVMSFGLKVILMGISAQRPGHLHLGVFGQDFTAWKKSLPFGAFVDVFANQIALLIWLVLVGIVLFVLTKKAGFFRKPPAAPPERIGHGEHGTARFRTNKELSETLGTFGDSGGTSGVVVGRKGNQEAWVAEEGHSLVLGTTGAGKSRRVFLPSIATVGTVRKDSMIITDPKGELWAHSAQWLEQQGYKVQKIDFRNPREGVSFNPMAGVEAALAKDNWGKAMALAADIADALVQKAGSEKSDPFWPESSKNLITSIILAIAQGTPDGDSFKAPSGQWPKHEQKHLASVRRALAKGSKDGDKVLEAWMEQFSLDHPARELFDGYLAAQGVTRASILTGALSDLRYFAEPEFAYLVSKQEAALEELGTDLDQPWAVFLVIPEDRTHVYHLVSLYLTQVIQSLVAAAERNVDSRLPRRVRFFLDEFGNIPPIPNFKQLIAISRGRNMVLVLVIQALGQLTATYGKEIGEIISANCNNWIYLMTNDLETAKIISGRLGNYSTSSENSSTPKVGFFGMTNSYVAHQTVTTNSISRALLDPTEIMRLAQTEALFMQAREYPAKTDLPDLSAWSWTKQIQKLNDYKMERGEAKVNTWTPIEELILKPKKKQPSETTNDDRPKAKTAEKVIVRDEPGRDFI